MFRLKVVLFDLKCEVFKYYRLLKNTFSAQSKHKYLFILCPQYCGSTLLQEILCTSPSVSPNNIFGTREGQSLPEFRKLIDYKKRWDPEYPYPWEKINRIWSKYWDKTQLFFLDKSPPNLLRAEVIQEIFDPAYFIIMVRDPYVHAEAMMRKNKMPIQEAAKHALKCLQFQKYNQKHLNYKLLIRYEDLCDLTDNTKKELLGFLPELEKINTNKKFNAHRPKSEKINNMNKSKIDNLSNEDLTKINSIFQKEKELLRFFNYEVI